MTTNSHYFKQQIYGFALGSAGGLLYRLKNIDCCYLIYPNNLNHYLSMLLHDQPPYILGLGSYSGVDQDQIRIETICTNQFRNDFIDNNKQIEIDIKPFVSQPGDYMKYTKAIGNSHCNKTCYEIMKLINQGQLKSQYTFLHVPKTFDFRTAIDVIDLALLEFKKSLK